MASAQSPDPSDVAEQVKHYKLYVFLTPTMFCIILFMLLYLFYLKKQASISHPSPTFTRAPSFIITVSHLSYMYILYIKQEVYRTCSPFTRVCRYYLCACHCRLWICNVRRDFGVIASFFFKWNSFL